MLADISLSGILWAILWLALFIIWFWLIIVIFSDLIHELELLLTEEADPGSRSALEVFSYLLHRGHAAEDQ